jgi:ribosomal protein L7/L12
MIRNTIVLLLLLVGSAVGLFAQEPPTKEAYLELLRSEISTRKVEIFTEAMQLTDAEGQKFWPLYREFDVKMAKIADQQIALIKEYATKFESLTDKDAQDLTDRVLKREENVLNLKREYAKKIAKQVSPKVGAKFLQVQNLLQQLIGVQVASALPLIK